MRPAPAANRLTLMDISSAAQPYELTRMFHELIWPQMQGAGREAVVNLPQAACNTADAAKVTRPKGEISGLDAVKRQGGVQPGIGLFQQRF